MKMKEYQQRVIEDLKKFLEQLETNSTAMAYKKFWSEKNISVGHFNAIQPYKNILNEIPSVCIKVPTGGGKTFIACNALKVICDKFSAQNKIIAWLVPSDAILTQTLAALKNSNHPYRQQINHDFLNQVAIYTKDEILNGQNFNSSTAGNQLSIMILSYDSFRGRKEILKSKQPNPNFNSFSDGDEISLIETFNRLNPIVIVDESHHAKTNLSIEMLKNFNPKFVLELTATPHSQSNIISFVNANELKNENMVKLPVIAYNQINSDQVYLQSITLRNNLEELAKSEEKYIRPIVLFQAQANISDDSETFEKIRKKLIEKYSIPKNQIAIRTSNIDELKNENLLSENCSIRYILTINALHEGWDCPFAYILASLANKSSAVDVEQILGRILRLPNTRRNKNNLLNMSYVITCSNLFQMTLENIVKALNGEGFSKNDCRVMIKPNQSSSQEELQLELTPENNFAQNMTTEEFFETAINEYKSYEENFSQNNFSENNLPYEVKIQMPRYEVKPEFKEDVEKICVPQFVYETNNLFSDTKILNDLDLVDKFDLKTEQIKFNFNSINEEIYKIDADKSGVMKSKLSKEMQKYIKNSCTTEEDKINRCHEIILKVLDKKFPELKTYDLKIYLNRIIENLDDENKINLQNFPLVYAELIKNKIEDLKKIYTEKIFYQKLASGKIKCENRYKMKSVINPLNAITSIERSLYTGEDNMNETEQKFIMNLTAFENIKWWHRNISRQEFFINGFINHYPDFMLMTTNGKIIFAETKGSHLNNEDTAQKSKLGHAWSQKAGNNYEYFMIFDDLRTSDLSNGITNMNEFLNLVRDF